MIWRNLHNAALNRGERGPREVKSKLLGGQLRSRNGRSFLCF